MIRANKRGFIAGETPKLLERLHIDPERFIVTSTQMMREFATARSAAVPWFSGA